MVKIHLHYNLLTYSLTLKACSTRNPVWFLKVDVYHIDFALMCGTSLLTFHTTDSTTSSSFENEPLDIVLLRFFFICLTSFWASRISSCDMPAFTFNIYFQIWDSIGIWPLVPHIPELQGTEMTHSSSFFVR